MAEQSFIFDFSRVDDFFEQMNIKFSISNMFKVTGYNSSTGAYTYGNSISGSKFELVIIEQGGDNISEYLTNTGALDTSSVSGVHPIDCNLDYYNQGNGEATIELHNTVSYTIGDNNMPLKAILLRDKSTGYIMGYSINMNPFNATNEIIFDDDVIFWDIRRYSNGG